MIAHILDWADEIDRIKAMDPDGEPPAEPTLPPATATGGGRAGGGGGQ